MSELTEAEQIKLMMKGIVSEMPEDDRLRFDTIVKQLREIASVDVVSKLAFGYVNIEIAQEVETL